MDTLFGAFLGSTASKNVSIIFLTDEDMLTKWCAKVDKKKASRSVRSEEKHIDFDLSTGEDQDHSIQETWSWEWPIQLQTSLTTAISREGNEYNPSEHLLSHLNRNHVLNKHKFGFFTAQIHRHTTGVRRGHLAQGPWQW